MLNALQHSMILNVLVCQVTRVIHTLNANLVSRIYVLMHR